ncbi:TnsA-like heteromeric transposase endonuclease subunit [Streptomyces sp. SM5]|uniref:TnsA-like heteromeric transposase endonuclease subunit n=1 Tax=Streptomyces sp. SM5 TaxID=402233 RepID=UPI0035BBAC13
MVGDGTLAPFELAFSANGTFVCRSLGPAGSVPFEAVDPVREFSWHKDGHGFAGWFYSSTMRDHVGYESWLERDRLILLDRDPQVVAITSQPFWLHRHDGTRKRRHAPDYFVRLSDGGAPHRRRPGRRRDG